ncbi:MAG: nuclear transport factor 2 family protein [Actinomycetota bacterium]
MSQENVEIVRCAYELFNEGGPEAVISAGIWSPEIVWDLSPSGIAGLGVYRGHDEVRAFFEEDWFGRFPSRSGRSNSTSLVDHGDQVIAVHHQRGLGASSGAAAELEQGIINTLHDGEIVRVEIYGDPAKALEAAGLSE